MRHIEPFIPPSTPHPKPLTLRQARHIEVQLLGDGQGGLVHLYERDCSVQRRRQKLIEVAPALGLSAAERGEMLRHALALGAACRYRSAGTVEFL